MLAFDFRTGDTPVELDHLSALGDETLDAYWINYKLYRAETIVNFSTPDAVLLLSML